jgi:tRNA-specific 2-thiouridylase
VDDEGRTVGHHDGIHGFTVGQRKNLGVSLGRRAYVTGIDPADGTVRLGAREALLSSSALLAEPKLMAGVTPPFDCDVMVRYRGTAHGARVSSSGAGLRVDFSEPVSAVVGGQYAVFLDGDRVLGGGVIRSRVPLAGTETRRLPLVTASPGEGGP